MPELRLVGVLTMAIAFTTSNGTTYYLGARLGSGGFGTVYEGTDGSTHTWAIKAISTVKQPDLAQAVHKEASLLASVSHPNFIGVREVVHCLEGVSFIVMERGDQSLADRLKFRALTLKEVCSAGIQILSAVEATHDRGIVHRDITPMNLIWFGDVLKIADFGIACTIDSSSTFVYVPPSAHPCYAPPEHFLSPGHVTYCWDIHQVGRCLLDCIIGKPLLHSDCDVRLAREFILAGVPAVVSESYANAGGHVAPLAELVSYMLDANPDRRPSAEYARNRLRLIANSIP